MTSSWESVTAEPTHRPQSEKQGRSRFRLPENRWHLRQCQAWLPFMQIRVWCVLFYQLKLLQSPSINLGAAPAASSPAKCKSALVAKRIKQQKVIKEQKKVFKTFHPAALCQASGMKNYSLFHLPSHIKECIKSILSKCSTFRLDGKFLSQL